MKKLFAIVLCLMLCMSAAACSSTGNSEDKDSNKANETTVASDNNAENGTTDDGEDGTADNPESKKAYADALSSLEAEDYEAAFIGFMQCRGYKDADDYLKKFKSVYGRYAYPQSGEDAYYDRIYDDKGNLIEEKDSKGHSIAIYTYDENSVPLTEKRGIKNTVVYKYVDNGDGTYTKLFDEESSKVSVEYGSGYTDVYDADMNCIKRYNDTTVVEYSYNEYGDMVKYTRTVDGEIQKSISYENEYDAMGNCIKITGYSADGKKYMEQINILDDMGNIVREERNMYDSSDYDVYTEITEYSDYQLFYIG